MAHDICRVLVIGGTTASGKSALALALAAQHNGTIINADSLQIYRDLPTLTAQPDAVEKAQAPHVLYGMLEANDRISASRWRDEALAAIKDAQRKGRVPILVGGTGFYLQALLQGLSPMPPIPASARQAAEKYAEDHGVEGLYAQIKRYDPAGAEKLDPKNRQRLVRAYEVFLATGTPLSVWQDQPRETPPEDLRFLVFSLLPERDVIWQRCEQRLRAMLEEGALQEIADFANRVKSGEVAADAPLTHACGYAPFVEALAGRISAEDAFHQALADTRQYAKRQETFFRNKVKAETILRDHTLSEAVLRTVDFFLKGEGSA